MTPKELQQALKVRTLRAEKAERVLRDARSFEAKAERAVRDVEEQLAAFDEALDARISAFYAKASLGLAPESLHSTRAFHADLASQRVQIETLMDEARAVLDTARQRSAEARAAWATADAAMRKLQEMTSLTEKEARRTQERRAEQDADEIAVARSQRRDV